MNDFDDFLAALFSGLIIAFAVMGAGLIYIAGEHLQERKNECQEYRNEFQ
jgi:hypothetical protein